MINWKSSALFALLQTLAIVTALPAPEVSTGIVYECKGGTEYRQGATQGDLQNAAWQPVAAGTTCNLADGQTSSDNPFVAADQAAIAATGSNDATASSSSIPIASDTGSSSPPLQTGDSTASGDQTATDTGETAAAATATAAQSQTSDGLTETGTAAAASETSGSGSTTQSAATGIATDSASPEATGGVEPSVKIPTNSTGQAGKKRRIGYYDAFDWARQANASLMTETLVFDHATELQDLTHVILGESSFLPDRRWRSRVERHDTFPQPSPI
jgi:hypothetical protein